MYLSGAGVFYFLSFQLQEIIFMMDSQDNQIQNWRIYVLTTIILQNLILL